MRQEVSVVAVYEKGKKYPKPIKFRLVENGENMTVDVYQILGQEHIGFHRLDYECNSLTVRGNLKGYKLQFFQEDGRWLIEMN